MTKLQNIRTQIKLILELVEGIGKVYDYYRYVNTIKELTDIGKDGKDFKLAMFREIKRKDPPADDELSMDRVWEITLLRQVNDSKASQKEIEDLAETVCDTIKDYDDLNGSIIEHKNAQIINIYEAYFSEILCHWAVLELETTEG